MKHINIISKSFNINKKKLRKIPMLKISIRTL